MSLDNECSLFFVHCYTGAMYLAIDVGATKTLLAIFSKDAKVLHEQKISTDKKYDRFLADLQSTLQQSEFKDYQITACCCAIPGKVDRSAGVGITLGNLPWQNVPIRSDLEKILGNLPAGQAVVPVFVE